MAYGCYVLVLLLLLLMCMQRAMHRVHIAHIIRKLTNITGWPKLKHCTRNRFEMCPKYLSVYSAKFFCTNNNNKINNQTIGYYFLSALNKNKKTGKKVRPYEKSRSVVMGIGHTHTLMKESTKENEKQTHIRQRCSYDEPPNKRINEPTE